MHKTIPYFVLITACLLQPSAGLPQEQPNATAQAFATRANPMTLVLDARDAARGLMVSHMTIPVNGRALTLVYPKWIPGEHAPTGPLNNVSELRISANGRDVSWHRDTIDMYAFHVDVPPGTVRIAVDFTVLLNAPDDTMATPNVAIVNWNRDLFYQNDVNSHDYFVTPSILLPPRWNYGTALGGAHQHGDRVDFETVPLNMLVDSPLDMGRYSKHVLLWRDGDAAQWLDAFADKPHDLDFPASEVAAYRRMTPQALALYGSRHWNQYHALLTLSDAIGFEGIEHHQSSDNRAPANFMTDAKTQMDGGDLLTHEFSHSWNGKYRRPADLTTLNFQIPQQTDLLWVYEGMNQYLGDVLSFRTKIREPKTYPEYLANVYARMDAEPGRMTTPLIDTTTGAPYFYQTNGDYRSLRRSAGDFYTEGHLIWLAADLIIRRQTGGRKTLDDFEHLFTQPSLTGPITKTYTREDVEALLNEVAPYDWHAFFQRYVYETAPHPPYDDIERAGWRLVYSRTPNEYIAAGEASDHSVDLWYSIGLRIKAEGVIEDVRKGSPAWSAGLAPGGKITAVNGLQYDADVLDSAISDAQHDGGPIGLLVNDGGRYATHAVRYQGGLRYPHLVRISRTPDVLSKIVAPR
jgi:predicted metalloprotease with PDZ domain